jgi:hypothetical protein
MSLPLSLLLTGYDITDEVINRSTSAALALEQDTIRMEDAGALEIWTGAGGTGTQLVLTTDYTLSEEDVEYSAEAGVGVTIYTKLAIVNGAYHATDLYVTYRTIGCYHSVVNVQRIAESTAKKIAIEYGHYLTEVFSVPKYILPHEWDADDPDTYFPAKCLTDIDVYEDLSQTNWGTKGIQSLRNEKTVFMQGLPTELTILSTGWNVTSNVGTLTFTNDALHIALLAALEEDKLSYGAYLRPITVPSAIGNIPAGDYLITGINPAAGTRTITFNVTASNGSGSGSFPVDFYACRIAGSTTTARVFSARGRAIHGAGDDNGYMVNGLARRGYIENHWHEAYYTSGATTGGGVVSGDGGTSGPITNRVKNVISDGVNSLRSAKDTNSPASSMHLYMQFQYYMES